MDHLRRELAPIGTAAWEQVEDEAKRTLRSFLSARALIDVTGPFGWQRAAVPRGRVARTAPSPVEGVVAGVCTVQPLAVLRAPFTLLIEELDGIERGAPSADFGPLQEAARLIAYAEDRAIFHGHDAMHVPGIMASSPHDALEIGSEYERYPQVVARAVAALRRSGVGGPYAIALGPRCYTGVVETTEHGGYPLLEHMRLILGGPLVYAPAIDGAVVLSIRHGDYELVSGQDLSIGYLTHTTDEVELYFEETFTLIVHDERAAVALRYPD